MSKELIQINEIEGGYLEIRYSGCTEKIKKTIDENQYQQKIHSFFNSDEMKALSSEEQIMARGFLAWSYFWPQTIYQELLSKYPLDLYDYKCDPKTDLARYLSWSKNKQAWNFIHWTIYFIFYLPLFRFRLNLLVGKIVVGFSIDDERWKNFTTLTSLKVGGGEWRMSSWLNSFPLLHPRKYSLVGNIHQKVTAHVKNMKFSASCLQKALPNSPVEMHFWDDFNYTYPLRLAANNNRNKIIVHQHAPSFTRIHVTGQIVSQFKMTGTEEWSCWDKEWATIASELNSNLKISIDEFNLPSARPIPFQQDGMVVFPWEAFSDNHLKKGAILLALNIGLPVAIKLRPGYSKDIQVKSFGLLNDTKITFVSDWKELNKGVRVIVAAQTLLLHQAYRQNIPSLVMGYASQTYGAWLLKKLPSPNLINCLSEQELFSALQALSEKDSARG